MGTFVTRNNFAFSLSEDAHRRAREYLLSVGYSEEQLKPIVWPEDAVSAYREYFGTPWEFTTKADILRGKRERMEGNLWFKREYNKKDIRALYVWVFWCPGISGIFEGLWTYIIGIGEEYHGGGYKGDLAGCLLDEVMRLFPLVERPLFPDYQYYNSWQREFIKKYQRGTWCGRPQGKAPIWAEVKGKRIVKILGREEWSKKKKSDNSQKNLLTEHGK